MNKKFYVCATCGNLVGMIKHNGPKISCCGKVMNELVANTTEASTEKHIPTVTIDGENIHVEVGSILHPMENEHYIDWVYISTEKGAQRKTLEVGSSPVVDFKISSDDKVLEVYAYCNLHGLWKVEL
ncbi:desulfoferrodoxin family protein [Romboutsia sp.]|uniref:desulfoferrodoxin family protein n=1 Tax=Romboutsia sp. TaxID=1965302 RepID=UPI003F2B1072